MDGITRKGSFAANGTAPSMMDDWPSIPAADTAAPEEGSAGGGTCGGGPRPGDGDIGVYYP